MSNGGIILQCADLCKSYQQGSEELRVLRNVDLSLSAGERLAILGASGSGKTTLLNMLGGLDLPSSGKIVVDGRDITSMSENARASMRNRFLGFVYQFHHLLAEFSALENVSLPLLMRKMPVKVVKEQAAEMLSAVGLGGRFEHKPSELSGGERQRVAIARALVTKPACVLMDEPTGNLDEQTAEKIQNLMQSLNELSNSAFITVTHDKRLAAGMDRILTLVDGHLKAV